MLRPWATLSLLIACGLLGAVYVVAKLTTPDPTNYLIPGYNSQATFHDYVAVLYRNSLVLALHAMACVAGFMAGSSMPLAASKRSGVSRWVHEKAGPLAIGFVVCATTFSLCTQAYVIGGGAVGASPPSSARAPASSCSRWLPHALPELFALFLPLAAWIIASRAGAWQDLLAATFVTVGDLGADPARGRRGGDLGGAAPARAVAAPSRPISYFGYVVDAVALWPVSSTNVTRTVRFVPLRPDDRGEPDLHVLAVDLDLARRPAGPATPRR